MTLAILSILGGCAILALGAELLVRGASRIALHAGLSPLVVGLTVVAYGTSAPELVVSLKALHADGAGLALGNIVGSNIFNVLFILGACAVITPLVVTREVIRRDVPIMVGASILVLALAWDRQLSALEGLLLAALAVIYTVWTVRAGRRTRGCAEAGAEGADGAEGAEGAEGADGADGADGGDGADGPPGAGLPGRGGRAWVASAALMAFGLGLLVAGARILVTGAVDVAKQFGLSDLVIGLTVVAAGTSMPEVATSIVAAIRGERNIAVGNVIGSNIGNLLFVLGLAAALAPDGVPVAEGALDFDLPVMVAAAFACLPIFVTGGRISRWEGAVFLAYFGAYTAYLLLRAAEHDRLPLFSAVMASFVLPLSGLTLGILVYRSLRRTRR